MATNTTTINVHIPKTQEAPKLAYRIGELAASAYLLFKQFRQATRATAEASRTREIANRVAHFDPRFAADLYASADRHEFLNGVDR